MSRPGHRAGRRGRPGDRPCRPRHRPAHGGSERQTLERGTCYWTQGHPPRVAHPFETACTRGRLRRPRGHERRSRAVCGLRRGRHRWGGARPGPVHGREQRAGRRSPARTPVAGSPMAHLAWLAPPHLRGRLPRMAERLSGTAWGSAPQDLKGPTSPPTGCSVNSSWSATTRTKETRLIAGGNLLGVQIYGRGPGTELVGGEQGQGLGQGTCTATCARADVPCAGGSRVDPGPETLSLDVFTCHAMRSLSFSIFSWASGCSCRYRSVKKAWRRQGEPLRTPGHSTRFCSPAGARPRGPGRVESQRTALRPQRSLCRGWVLPASGVQCPARSHHPTARRGSREGHSGWRPRPGRPAEPPLTWMARPAGWQLPQPLARWSPPPRPPAPCPRLPHTQRQLDPSGLPRPGR